jgi:fumarate reductase flavoprotein subunit
MKKIFLFLFLLSFSFSVSFAKDYEADLIIVGGGWSGLIAGVAAHEAGVKTIILEKQPTLGGQGVLLGANTAWGHELTAVDGKKSSIDEVYKKYMEYSRYLPNGLLMRKLLKEMPESITWMVNHGIKYTPIVFEGNTNVLFIDGGGAVAVAEFNRIISNSRYVTALTETPVKHLIIEKGAVTGVIAENDGEEVRVKGKYVILASGTITGDQEMMKQYAPQIPSNIHVFGNQGRTGDGIKLALEAGAKVQKIISTLDSEAGHTLGMQGTERTFTPEKAALYNAVRLPYLWINQRGKRFVDEGVSAMMYQGNALISNNNMYYSIFDEPVKNDLIKGSGIPIGGGLSFLPPGAKLEKLDEGLELGYKSGYAFKANTLDELADKLGVDKATLKATVARQNQFAKNKYDDDLLKDPKFLRVLDKGPFYAVKAEHTINGLNGGVYCDENLQVIREDLSPIQGLYVTGILIGGINSDTYPMLITAGGGSGFGMSASRIIVRNVANELKTVKK